MAFDRKDQIKETLRTRVFALVKKREKPSIYKRGSKYEGKEKKDDNGNTIFTQWNNEDFYNDFSEKYNYKYDRVKGWFTKTMPDYPEIMDIAEYFSVSVDYLIGKTDIESTITADSISRYTGLEIHSVNRLNEYYRKGYQWQLNTIDAINFLLERKETATLLENTYHFFFGNYTHTKAKDDTIEIFDEDDCGGAAVIVSDMQQPLFLSFIINSLTAAYERFVKDNPQYKDYGKPTKENHIMRCVKAQSGTKLERLEKVRKNIIRSMEHNQKCLDKYKGAKSNKITEMYSSLLESDNEDLKIVEDKIRNLQQ